MGNEGDREKKYAGYEYLLVYKLSVPVYDYTVAFVDRWVGKYTRTGDQMTQAARSGMQNTVEGNKQQGLKGYIKLSGVSRGSFEELLKDYLAFVRQRKLELWAKAKCEREIREIGEIWKVIRDNKVLPDFPDFPDLPKDSEVAANMMITLVNQSNYLLDRLIESLKVRHMKQGGLTEELYRKRKEYRGF